MSNFIAVQLGNIIAQSFWFPILWSEHIFLFMKIIPSYVWQLGLCCKDHTLNSLLLIVKYCPLSEEMFPVMFHNVKKKRKRKEKIMIAASEIPIIETCVSSYILYGGQWLVSGYFSGKSMMILGSKKCFSHRKKQKHNQFFIQPHLSTAHLYPTNCISRK